jgi:hypothetical protein
MVAWIIYWPHLATWHKGGVGTPAHELQRLVGEHNIWWIAMHMRVLRVRSLHQIDLTK